MPYYQDKSGFIYRVYHNQDNQIWYMDLWDEEGMTPAGILEQSKLTENKIYNVWFLHRTFEDFPYNWLIFNNYYRLAFFVDDVCFLSDREFYIKQEIINSQNRKIKSTTEGLTEEQIENLLDELDL